MSILTSALSFSAFNSSSIFKIAILGFSNDFGYYSNPAYDNVFQKQTPYTKKEADSKPSVIFEFQYLIFLSLHQDKGLLRTPFIEKYSLYIEKTPLFTLNEKYALLLHDLFWNFALIFLDGNFYVLIHFFLLIFNSS